MAAVDLIPPEGEREWVLDALRELVVACGHEHLVSAPVVLPSPRCFPDAWSPDERGVRRLALRLLRYAALDELDVEIETFDDDDADSAQLDLGAGVHTQAHEGAAAWFAGIVDGTCWFGANVSLLDDPGGVTAALAHETAHAFRHVHELVVEDRNLEECLTDLSTIYLGFGVLTANASLRHRSWSLMSDGGAVGGHAWSTSQLGYLSPQALCFALAAFVRVRDRGPAERRAVVDALHTNQAGFFKAAERWLERVLGGLNGLRARLGLPDPARWPAPAQLDELLAAPLDDEGDEAEDPADLDRPLVADEDEDEEGWNAGGKVYRVPYPSASHLGLVVMLATLGAAVTLFVVDQGLLAVAVLPVGVVFERRLSRRFLRYECSTCNGAVRPSDERCALCGGTVVGTLARAEDRLELPEP